jgi:hypothetical protein
MPQRTPTQHQKKKDKTSNQIWNDKVANICKAKTYY